MERLRKRRDFLKAARGRRWTTDALVLQARRRQDEGPIRVGFTATKKLGGAVVRNRARRRLREAARQIIPHHGLPGYDYVLIGRRGTLTRGFSEMLDDLKTALHKVHRQHNTPGPAVAPADKTSSGSSSGAARAG